MNHFSVCRRELRGVTLFAAPLVLSIACVAFLVSTLQAQDPSSDRAAFEVASVKPNKLADAPRGTMTIRMGSFLATGVTLKDLMRLAYASESIQTPDQIIGGPSWIGSDRFDVNATAQGTFAAEPDGSPSRRLRAMLRGLLEDRFAVKTHTESREFPIYALVVARPGQRGPKLATSTSDCIMERNSAAAAGVDASVCAVKAGPGVLAARGITMARLARALANFPVVGRVVEDRTGFEGFFDVDLEFTPVAPAAAAAAAPASDLGPSLFTALQDQLGLKLEATRGPLQVLIVDTAQQPTEN